MRWQEIKRQLQVKDEKFLLSLLKSLYELNDTNKSFIHASTLPKSNSAIEFYKKVISEALDPHVDDPVELAEARKAISEYRKAVPNDKFGYIDLMLHYVEAGTNHTLKYGDMDEKFYNSLCSMMDRILLESKRLPSSEHRLIVKRVVGLDRSVRDQIGWGYSDHLEEAANEIKTQLKRDKPNLRK